MKIVFGWQENDACDMNETLPAVTDLSCYQMLFQWTSNDKFARVMPLIVRKTNVVNDVTGVSLLPRFDL